jgi:cellulose biosynthesis protein BcsQ
MTDIVAVLWERLTKEIAQSSPLDFLVTLLAAIILLGLGYGVQRLLRAIWRLLSTEVPPWWACCRKLARTRAAIDEKGPGLWLTINHEPLPGIVSRLSDTGKLILTIANLKGGVGKTTLTANLAAYFANPFDDPDRSPQRVLVLDLDFQGSLSSMLFAGTEWRPREDLLSPASQIVSGIVDAGLRAELGQPVTRVDRARGIGAFYDLARIENREMIRWLTEDEPTDIRYRLAQLLLSDVVLSRYDVILIDAPPRLTTASIQALCASTHVLIPTVLDALSADAVGYFGQQLLAHERLWPHLKIMGVVGTMTDRQRQGSEEPALSGDRLREALSNGGARLKHIMTKGATFELPYACSTFERADLARAAGQEIAYVSASARIRGEARRIFDPLGNEVKRRWQL